MKAALFGKELLNNKALNGFIREHNVAKVIVSAKACPADLDCEDISFQDGLECCGCSFEAIDHTLIVVDTKTKEWKRYYFNLFSEEETDLISVLAEDINRVIDRYSARYLEYKTLK